MKMAAVKIMRYTLAKITCHRHTFNYQLIRKLNSEPAPKRIMVEKKKIGTHNGTFHCDEALACFLLKMLPEYKDAEVIRTRDPSVLQNCDIVVDVGGIYDSSKHLYDHHQRDFKHTMQTFNKNYPWVTKLSSAGLIYAHFGHLIIANFLKSEPDTELVTVIFKKVYENFIEEIDAIDNGINQTDEKPKYLITTNLSSRVSYLNPKWNEPSEGINDLFKKAMELVGSEFLDKVHYYSKTWWPAREIVKQAVLKRFEIHSSGEIIEFPQGGCPWKEHLLELEEEININPPIKFVIFPDQNMTWRVQCVPLKIGSFENRLSLLEEWQGLRDDSLTEKSGIPGCVFVHATGFIGGNKTQDGVLQMALKTLEKNKG